MPFFVPPFPGSKAFWIFLLLCALVFACEDESVTIPDGALQEHTVDLEGTWKVKQVLLNNQDITSIFDFEQIELHLEMDQLPTNFTIETGSAPFPVIENGRWEFNDPSYPTSISFDVDNTKRSVDFSSPPISGDNSFKISFSLGCPDNIYTYHFEKQ